MLLTTFIVAIVLIFLAAILFSSGLVRLYKKSNLRARSIMSTGFIIGLLGIVIAALIFNIGNI